MVREKLGTLVDAVLPVKKAAVLEIIPLVDDTLVGAPLEPLVGDRFGCKLLICDMLATLLTMLSVVADALGWLVPLVVGKIDPLEVVDEALGVKFDLIIDIVEDEEMDVLDNVVTVVEICWKEELIMLEIIFDAVDEGTTTVEVGLIDDEIAEVEL